MREKKASNYSVLGGTFYAVYTAVRRNSFKLSMKTIKLMDWPFQKFIETRFHETCRSLGKRKKKCETESGVGKFVVMFLCFFFSYCSITMAELVQQHEKQQENENLEIYRENWIIVPCALRYCALKSWANRCKHSNKRNSTKWKVKLSESEAQNTKRNGSHSIQSWSNGFWVAICWKSESFVLIYFFFFLLLFFFFFFYIFAASFEPSVECEIVNNCNNKFKPNEIHILQINSTNNQTDFQTTNKNRCWCCWK